MLNKGVLTVLKHYLNVFTACVLCISATTVIATGNGGNDMMRKEIDEQRYFDQHGFDLKPNLDQSIDTSKECLEKDETHMGGHSGNNKYACMPGYENTPQKDIGDFDTPPRGEHPIFEDRMKD